MASLRTNIPVIFGLVSFVVSVDSATTEVKGACMTCVGHPADKAAGITSTTHSVSKIKMRMYCPVCDEDGRKAFGKGFEVSKDEVVVIPADVVEKINELPDAVKKTISLSCRPALDVEEKTLPGEKFYYLNPAASATEAYAVMVDAVRRRTDIAFVCEFAVRGVAAFYRLGVLNDALVLKELARPETVVQAPAAPTAFNPQLVPMVDAAINSLLVPFDAAEFADKRTIALAAHVAASQPTALTVIAGEAPTEAPLDLMAALRKSVELHSVPAQPTKAKRAPRKAAPAKAAPAKRTRTKQTA